MTKKITKKMKFSELLKKHPESGEILAEKGMFCFGCPYALQETIEQGACAHGFDAEEVVKEINKKVKK